MSPRIISALALLLTLLFAATGCERKNPAAPAGVVKANPAYVEYFGQPPTPEKGSCFARVGFYPLRGEPGKVRAVPYFLFEEKNELQQILNRMVGEESVFPPSGPLFNPFPPGTKIASRVQPDGVVELNLSAGGGALREEALPAVAAALTETATQFPDVKRVRILLDGAPLAGMPADGFRHDPARIAPLGPPELLMVVGSWEEGASDPEEILADFDRPVTVNAFRLQDASGQDLKGEYFTSAFDMAVVLHPGNPGAFREGMTLRAQWDVTDRLGRQGKGSGEFVLKRHVHPPQNLAPPKS